MNAISFQAQNINIKKSQRIIHKISTDFPFGCPWKINRIREKHTSQGSFITAPILNEKLDILRESTVPDFLTDYNYAAKTLEGIKHFKVANCKEASELSYMIAVANKVKNCYCASLYSKISDYVSELKDLGHCVLLIFPKKLNQTPDFTNKYYVNTVSMCDTLIPDAKTILIDPLFGIADYWHNALKKYGSTIFKLPEGETIRAALRYPLLTREKDIEKIRKYYPILLFDNKNRKMKTCFKFKKEDTELKKFIENNTGKYCETYPISNNAESENIFSKLLNNIDKMFSSK